jgi:hypothetical protein
MPGYDDHVGVAKILAVLIGPLIAGATYVLTSDPRLAAIGLFGSGLVVLGGMMPDLDSNSSIPRRRLVAGLTAALVLGIGIVAGRYWEQAVGAAERVLSERLPQVPPELVVASLVAAAVVLVLAKTGDGVQAVLPAHRGLFHELAFWLGIGVALGVGIYVVGSLASLSPTVTLYSAVVLPALLVLGVSGHLVQDGEIV